MQCTPCNQTGKSFLIPLFFHVSFVIDVVPSCITSACGMLTAHHSGQGGDQSLHDTVNMLPKILVLNDIARSLDGKTALTEAQIGQARQRYGKAMIDRAFQWVRKSGRTSFPHLDLDGWLGTVAKACELDDTAGDGSSLSRMWARAIDQTPRTCSVLGGDSPETISTNGYTFLRKHHRLVFDSRTFVFHVQVSSSPQVSSKPFNSSPVWTPHLNHPTVFVGELSHRS